MVYMNAFYLTSTCVFSIRETWLGDIQQRASLLLKLDLFYKHNWNLHNNLLHDVHIYMHKKIKLKKQTFHFETCDQFMKENS